MIDSPTDLKRLAVSPPPNYEGWQVVHLSGLVTGLAVNWDYVWSGQRNLYSYDPAQYKGIVFVGEGPQKTVVMCNGTSNSAIHVGCGNVAFESMKIECNYPGGTIIRTSVEHGDPVFLTLRNVVEEATGPIKWGNFLYHTDDTLEDVEIISPISREHASYAHGFAQGRSSWTRVRVRGAGAECDKRVGRPEEGAKFYQDQIIHRVDCIYEDWHQPHSPMGGGVVIQGAAAHVLLERCIFRPSARQPSKSFMVDDSYKIYGENGVPYTTARFFDIRTGRGVTPQDIKDTDCANGWVIANECAWDGYGGENYTPMVRVGSQVGGTTHKLARGVLIQGSGIYGANTKVELKGIERSKAGKELIAISGCNTPEVQAGMRAIGFGATAESMIAAYGHPWKKVSAGFEPV